MKVQINGPGESVLRLRPSSRIATLDEPPTSIMATAAEEPSEASRLEAVAEAGMGADDHEHAAKLSNDENTDGAMSGSPALSSDGVGEEPKKDGKPEEPQRSKLKVVLIMGSLCVSLLVSLASV